MKIKFYYIHILLLTLLSVTFSQVRADEGHNHNSHEHEHHNTEHDHHDHEDKHSHSEIPDQTAADAGISTKRAKSGTITKTVKTYGLISVPPDRIIHVRARFPGIVKDVKVSMGESVKQGDVLAIIESNESLKSYEVKAAMDGTIQHRLINIGELTDEGTLFTIINTEMLWAELRIFPSQREHISPNQAVEIETTNQSYSTKIDHITASLQNTPYVTARAFIKNQNNKFAPGELAQARVKIKESTVAVLVDNLAIQNLDENKVVFVKSGNHYERRVVQVGQSDEHHTEIVTGLHSGEEYVAENSYLIKADIEKSSAEHHH